MEFWILSVAVAVQYGLLLWVVAILRRFQRRIWVIENALSVRHEEHR